MSIVHGGEVIHTYVGCQSCPAVIGGLDRNSDRNRIPTFRPVAASGTRPSPRFVESNGRHTRR